MQRIILLVDMDAFYTSCEEVRNPKLKGKPVAVGANPLQGKGRGVISTANYAARKYGIHSAIPVSIAYRKCPFCVFLPVDMEYYAEVSSRVMNIIKKYSDKFEQVSIDEGFADISSQGSFEKARDVARKIKLEILKKEKITCSVGIGPNKIIAKMASSKNKPNGLTIVTPSGVQKFLDPHDVDDIPGVGPKTTAVLHNFKIMTVKNLRETALIKLKEYFGDSFASYLYDSSRGKDESTIVEDWTQKSIGRHHTFDKDTKDEILIKQTMDGMVDDCFNQLKEQGFHEYKTVTIKVRYEDFSTYNKAYTMIAAADSEEPGKNVSRDLLKEFLRKNKKIRLIGVSLSKLK